MFLEVTMSTPVSSRSVIRDIGPPPVPGRKVAGWIIVLFSIIPLAMAIKGEGAACLLIGGTALAAGGTLALWPSKRSDT
jgi:hypothetical protein